MIKVIFNDRTYDVEDGTTLQEFIAANGTLGVAYTVGGNPLNPAAGLQNYAVIEENENGVIVNETLDVTMVSIDLTDFTGRSERGYRVANTLAAIREMYNQDVRISVVRNNVTTPTETLMNGDRVMVVPAGGVKGA